MFMFARVFPVSYRGRVSQTLYYYNLRPRAISSTKYNYVYWIVWYTKYTIIFIVYGNLMYTWYSQKRTVILKHFFRSINIVVFVDIQLYTNFQARNRYIFLLHISFQFLRCIIRGIMDFRIFAIEAKLDLPKTRHRTICYNIYQS